MAGLSPARLAAIAAVAVGCALLPTPPLAVQLAVGLPVVAVFGLPHGAHDWALARAPAGPGLAVAMALYAGLGGAAALAAVAVPWLALAAFLLLGIAHFGAEDAAALRLPTTPGLCAALGLPPVFGPWAFWPGQTAHVLQLLGSGLEPASVRTCGWVALAAGAALLGTAMARHPGARPVLAREQAALLLLMAAAPPVLSFTVYFCLVHAPRHDAALPPALRRWVAGPVSAAAIVLIALPVGLAALRLGEGWVWAATRALFWGLAALAWPHAALGLVSSRLSRTRHFQEYVA